MCSSLVFEELLCRSGARWHVPSNPSACLHLPPTGNQIGEDLTDIENKLSLFKNGKFKSSQGREEVRDILSLHVSGYHILKVGLRGMAKYTGSLRELSRVPKVWEQQEPQVSARHIGREGTCSSSALRDQVPSQTGHAWATSHVARLKTARRNKTSSKDYSSQPNHSLCLINIIKWAKWLESFEAIIKEFYIRTFVIFLRDFFMSELRYWDIYEGNRYAELSCRWKNENTGSHQGRIRQE